MSVVVAVKYKDGIILGSDRQITSGHLNRHTTHKIKPSKYSNTAIGCVGNLRGMDIIFNNIEELMDYKDILDNVKINTSYIVNRIVPRIISLCKDNFYANISENELYIPNRFLICDYNKIYSIFEDGSVCTAKTFDAIGCGEELAIGYLENAYTSNITKDEATQLVLNAIQVACKSDVYVNSQVDLINIMKNKMEHHKYNKDDED